MNETNKMVWLDLETTGLDPDDCDILEIAVAITDLDLIILHEVAIVVHQGLVALGTMNEFCQDMHAKTGLTRESRLSRNTDRDVEKNLMTFLRVNGCDARENPMCGNSIGFDRAFLKVHMPRLEAMFHYRNIDVSTIKMLQRYWYPDVPFPDKFAGGDKHRALNDVHASIAELKLYRRTLFRPTPSRTHGPE